MHSVLIGGQVQKRLLEAAQDMRLTDGSLMFVPYDTLLYSLPYVDVPHPALSNNSKLLRAYDAVLTITVQSQQHSFYQAYQQAIDSGELHCNIKPQQVKGPIEALNILDGWRENIGEMFICDYIPCK